MRSAHVNVLTQEGIIDRRADTCPGGKVYHYVTRPQGYTIELFSISDVDFE
jgi:hypothetical protein